MFGRFSNRFNTTGSGDQAFESACACASFFAALLLLVDTVIAVSIFVSADYALRVGGVLVSVLVCIFILRVLLALPRAGRSKPSAA